MEVIDGVIKQLLQLVWAWDVVGSLALAGSESGQMPRGLIHGDLEGGRHENLGIGRVSDHLVQLVLALLTVVSGLACGLDQLQRGLGT